MTRQSGIMQRSELLVAGVVQGVGFRPFCVKTALALGLAGMVRNTSGGVEIVLEGDAASIDEYVRVLREEHPAAAVVSGIRIRSVSITRRTFSDFAIAESQKSEEQRVLIPADLAVCGDCLAEMHDPRDRRYRYPFINCTACGPRYTIIRSLPYDRPMTTMRDFPMCSDCEREYGDSSDRRYHAQPDACPVCGPKVWLTDRSGTTLCEKDAAIVRLVAEISAGRIAAVKGVGGFHIACLPEDGPVGELRLRKHRPDKPFALMVRDLEAARRIVELSPGTERLLTGAQRPVVLCPSRAGIPISSLVASGQKRLGIMLPYAPLHHLIMEKFEALVMTSANLSDAPIVSSNEEALSALADIVDFVLFHNRDIHTAIDDSVLIPGTTRNIFLRRARGYVPNPMSFPFEGADILAAGAQMKSTYALARDGTLFPGQYLGDLDQMGTVEYYKRSLAHFLRLYEIEPKVLASDKHPGYSAGDLALGFCGEGVVRYPVQHHHAHFASVLLDNRFRGPAIGVIFDGTGYGDDGTIWGGEFLVGDIRSFRRTGSLLPCRLPGGERAIREPWRYALALLTEALGEEEARRIAGELWPQYGKLADAVRSAFSAAPVTTSCGRLFDGAAALLNLCPAVSYDGQAALALENAADVPEGIQTALPFGVRDESDFISLDWRPAVKSLVSSRGSRGEAACAFHKGLTRAICEACELLRHKTGMDHVALSGGVWQNRLLFDMTCEELRNRGLIPLVHRDISPNDEGVSVGQAAVAAYNLFGISSESDQ